MKTEEFRTFLAKEKKRTMRGEESLTEGAINARISRAGRLEKELAICLDEEVENVDRLKELKRKIKDNYPMNVSSTLYNTATRYYKFVNGEEPEEKYKDYLKI